MTVVGLIGILLSFVGLLFASVRPSQGRTIFAIFLILLHIAASVAYYAYALSNPADSFLYYYDTVGMRRWDFAFGTVFLVQAVDPLKTIMGATYLDCFLLFQSFGAWGIILLFRTFQEIHDELGQQPSDVSYALLLLPGVHFWTSALGKDAPMFFAVSLAVWAAMRLPSRLAHFLGAVGLMVLFRPHIAFVATIAVALTAFFDQRANRLTKAALLVVAIAAASYVALTVESTFRVDVTDANSVSDFFQTQQEISQTIDGGTSVHGAPYVWRLVSLLFRPFFIDANGFMALISSGENLVFLLITGFVALNVREGLWLARRVFFLRFALFFATAMVLLLAAVYYNVGLGLRQKVMIYPAVLSFFIAHWTFHRGRRRARRNLPSDGLLEGRAPAVTPGGSAQNIPPSAAGHELR